jgi:hypothetical protein
MSRMNTDKTNRRNYNNSGVRERGAEATVGIIRVFSAVSAVIVVLAVRLLSVKS